MTTPNFTPEDIKNNKGIASVSYLSILFFIPFVAAKDSPFAQFHAKQGLALFIAEVIMTLVFNPLFILALPILNFIYFPLLIAAIVLSIMGIMKALQGQAWEMPVIGALVKVLKI